MEIGCTIEERIVDSALQNGYDTAKEQGGSAKEWAFASIGCAVQATKDELGLSPYDELVYDADMVNELIDTSGI